MSTRERSTSSFVSILCCNSVQRWPLARFASMQSSSISMNAAVMCLRYSNFSGFLMFVVRSFTRICSERYAAAVVSCPVVTP